LSLSFGYKSFQDSYYNHIPSFGEWVYPIDTKGDYCFVSNLNETALILSNSNICWNGIQCGHSNVTVYGNIDCTGPPYTPSPNYNFSFVSLTHGTQKTVWTTYISHFYSAIQQPEPLWILSLSVIIISIAMVGIHLVISIYKYYKTKRWNFIAFMIGYLLAITEFVTVYLAFTKGSISAIYPNIFYSLSSGFTMALNGVCLMEIIFSSVVNRIAVGGLIFVLYFCFGVPYITYAIIHHAPKSPLVTFLKQYFDNVAYPVWQIVCAVADPLTAGMIIAYIVKACLVQHTGDKKSIVELIFSDYKLVAIFVASFLNFATITFLQLATSYTMFARNDKVMTMYQTVFSLQHAVSACCTLWYYLHFPIVLEAGKKLRRELAKRKTSQKEKGNKTVQSERVAQQDSLVTNLVTAKNLL
ncbi:hypothetical protein HDV01_004658, partial [Terramyces sp. JEL0728]